jgi:2-polyprenyl-6-methoxyphenol hydroxylase-like FAD-dependent oxidoreductase
MDPQSSGARTHVIIVGAGVAGLLAARVLSDYFKSVTIIERDALTAQPEPRKGVPQGHHVHGLLAKGQEILAQLFPGLISALNASGEVSVVSTAASKACFARVPIWSGTSQSE